MDHLEIHQFTCRADNFCVFIRDAESGVTAAIDSPNADCVLLEAAAQHFSLSHLFITHDHYDHIDGLARVKAQTGCKIIGAEHDRGSIPGLDHGVKDGDSFMFGQLEVKVLATPGHTLGHVTYWLPQAKIAFTGDTLFSLGCGRLFGGTAAQMYASLQAISQLPDETQIYCGHEYTLNNGAFALDVEPSNQALQNRVDEVRALMRARESSLPVQLKTERQTNPFLRVDQPEIQTSLGMVGKPLVEVFAALRKRKDAF